MLDLLLRPHCDLHMAQTGAPPLRPTLHTVEEPPASSPPTAPYVVKQVPIGQCEFEFFAPHKPKGQRLQGVPTYSKANGTITAPATGIFLFQAHFADRYLVGRLQVHRSMDTWWFGNDSLTTALDPTVGHAQPSVYAKFSDDDTGTDLIGDITGHGYVELKSLDPTKVVVMPDGRLRGAVVTQPNETWTVSGTALGRVEFLPVRVVDYSAEHPLTQRHGSLTDLDNKHNVLFLAEGFREQDRARFDEIVTRVTHELFEKPAHQPYGMLRDGFNVFAAFSPSGQHMATCGFPVTDAREQVVEGRVKGIGVPVPDNRRGPRGDLYTLEDLVRKVGLPRRGEQRTPPELLTEWGTLDLDRFEPDKVDPPLVEAWKKHRTGGILQTRDTFFGLCVGVRLADRSSEKGAVPKPAQDGPNDPVVKTFVARMYEFFRNQPTRRIGFDPRRHPPAYFLPQGFIHRQHTFHRYLDSVRVPGSTLAIGAQWQPDPSRFRRSYGLVGLIVNDSLWGGTNFQTALALSLNRHQELAYVYPSAVERQLRRRDPESALPIDWDDAVAGMAHEFAHTFNLGDEYEFFALDESLPLPAEDLARDNVSQLGFLVAGAPADRHVDPDKVKWLKLPRIRAAAVLLADSVNVTSPVRGVKLTIGTGNTAEWEQARTRSTEVRLRAFNPPADGRQLPLKETSDEYLPGLLVGQVLAAEGAIVLTRAGTTTFPLFRKGSLVYIPLKDNHGQPLAVVEQKVLNHLRTNKAPLNRNPDRKTPTKAEDVPVDIPGFDAPCRPARLIGIFEGAANFSNSHYRPTGRCKMRDGPMEFCFVCAWLIVNRVNPALHPLLDKNHYPESKKEAKKHE
ncbi:hypothetical protein IHE55_00620 [Streptomyces pactum]|uniref:Uncharacterized protein n=1 Tax=Streptomyces pactum TaxID=68249 RepID=A0ABS0NDW0_9ACTN|nr:hypothetical protein [Streptomyces pactum]MBH5333384.1 hypothetical protein [Streptomyces pactum]